MHLNSPKHWILTTGLRGLEKVSHNLGHRGNEILANWLTRAACYMGRCIAITAGQTVQSRSPASVDQGRWGQVTTIICPSPESAVRAELFIQMLLHPTVVYNKPTIISC